MKDVMILFVTSFSRDFWECSARKLINSYIANNVIGRLLCCYEGTDYEFLPSASVIYKDITDHPLLLRHLEQNREVIPESLGGTAKPCNCNTGKQYKGIHEKLGCHYCWWNRNSFRWFRKIVALQEALKLEGFSHIVWLDCDCKFKKSIKSKAITNAFLGQSVFYLQGLSRKHPETGVMGFDLKKKGQEFIEALSERYFSGAFRQDERWDDCWQFQLTRRLTAIPCRDLVKNLKCNPPLDKSPLAPYIIHNKGTHGRILGIMK